MHVSGEEIRVTIVGQDGEDVAVVRWRVGSHTANVFDTTGREIDCFTFAWFCDEPTRNDFDLSLTHWMNDADISGEW